MLDIFIPESEFYDDENNLFITKKSAHIVLEHSLYAISKWESRHHKPFYSKDERSKNELLDYIKCMTVSNSLEDDEVYTRLSQSDIDKIAEYMKDSMTATTFSQNNDSNKSSIVTSELIYYAMIANNIPFECDKWHINKLNTLIRVCQIKNNPPKKMSREEQFAQQRELNELRKKQFNTRG